MKTFDKPEMSDGERQFERTEMSDGERQFERTEMPDGESQPGNRPGRQEMPVIGERPFEPGEVQGQGSTLILLGISILVLLSGLFMATKIKY